MSATNSQQKVGALNSSFLTNFKVIGQAAIVENKSANKGENRIFTPLLVEIE